MKILITSFAFFIGLFTELTYSQSVTNQENIQLSIFLTNNIITAGTNVFLQCQIKNSSSNMISLRHPLALPNDTHLFLINNSGKTIELTPSSIIGIGSEMIGSVIKADKIYEWVNPFEIGTNVETGEYKLEAIRYIHSINGTNYQGSKLISNLLKVQVK
jgi:hypothetical protein